MEADSRFQVPSSGAQAYRQSMDTTREYSHPAIEERLCINSMDGQTFGPDDGFAWTPKREGARRMDQGERISLVHPPWCWYVTETDTSGMDIGKWTCEDCKGTFLFYVMPRKTPSQVAPTDPATIHPFPQRAAVSSSSMQ